MAGREQWIELGFQEVKVRHQNKRHQQAFSQVLNLKCGQTNHKELEEGETWRVVSWGEVGQRRKLKTDVGAQRRQRDENSL